MRIRKLVLQFVMDDAAPLWSNYNSADVAG